MSQRSSRRDALIGRHAAAARSGSPCRCARRVRFLAMLDGPAIGSTPSERALARGGPSRPGRRRGRVLPWHGRAVALELLLAVLERRERHRRADSAIASAGGVVGRPRRRAVARSTGTVPSGGTKRVRRARLAESSSKACTAFCHFICGNQVSDHCSQQPSRRDEQERRAGERSCARDGGPYASTRLTSFAWWARSSPSISATSRSVQLTDEPELLGREARAVAPGRA